MTVGEAEAYARAMQEVKALSVPQLFDENDPRSRVLFVLQDGTGNDVENDPQHATNVGILALDIDVLKRTNRAIESVYVPGPGTQGGLGGVLDQITGESFLERVAQAFRKSSLVIEKWLEKEPAATISIVAVGFSRGAEQTAIFTRVVDELGVSIADSKPLEVSELQTYQDLVDSLQGQQLVAKSTIRQAVMLFDPVGTGEPSKHDRTLPPSVVSGLQINAVNENRAQFPVTNIITQGASQNGQRLGISVPGAHSDVGGGYLLNEMSNRSYNVMVGYLNGLLGKAYLGELKMTAGLSDDLIHDSVQHKLIYRRVEVREQLEPVGQARQSGVARMGVPDPVNAMVEKTPRKITPQTTQRAEMGKALKSGQLQEAMRKRGWPEEKIKQIAATLQSSTPQLSR